MEALKKRIAWHSGHELVKLGAAAKPAVPELLSLAESQPGRTAKMLRDFAFQIDRAAALACGASETPNE